MAISKDKKRDIVAKLTSAFKDATALAFVGFSKLTVADASKVRAALKGAGVDYYVVKKTLLRRALSEKGYQGEIPELPGEVAVAWTAGPDTTAPTRGIYAEGRKLKGALTLLGGVFEDAYLDQGKATEIALIPSLPVLRGMFVNVINSPIQGLVIALDQISKKKSA